MTLSKYAALGGKSLKPAGYKPGVENSLARADLVGNLLSCEGFPQVQAKLYSAQTLAESCYMLAGCQPNELWPGISLPHSYM